MRNNRNRYGAPKEPPFLFGSSVSAEINKLENNVIAATAPVTFDLMDVARWCLSPDVLEKLIAARTMVHEFDSTSVFTMPLYGDTTASVKLCFKSISAQPSASVLLSNEIDAVVVPYLKKLQSIVSEFDKVRYVLKWFNEHRTTAGAVRAIWPTIQAITPAGHPVHDCNGLRYKDPDGVTAILSLVRETASIVASAQLAPTADRKTDNMFSVAFHNMSGQHYTLL
jgi:hypothetical protein